MDAGQLCTACLCADRELYFIGETALYNVYTQILNEIPIYDMSHVTVKVCWECRALLRRYQTFKQCVKNNYRELLQFIQQDVVPKLDTLTKQPRLRVHNIPQINFPKRETEWDAIKEELKEPTDNMDMEFEYIKSEPNDVDLSDSCDHHSEPETFAHDLKVINQVTEVAEAADSKGKDRKKMKKVKQKRRGRKKKVETEGSSEGMSDLDSLLEFYTNKDEQESETIEKTEKPKKEAKYNEEEIKTITLTVEEMLREREKELNCSSFQQKKFRCNDCVVAFKDDKCYEAHMMEKHSEAAGRFACPTCAVRFPDAARCRRHAAAHLARFACAACGRRGAALAPMLRHVRAHRQHTCHLCGELSGSLLRHQSHMSKRHAEKPQCAECGKMFSSRKTYRYHLNVIHKGQNRFPCPQCGKVYQWKSNLWRHIKNHKARDSGELYCSPCDKRFSSVATYQQHLKISRRHVSENDYSFMCSECGKRFVSKTRLRDHVDWEHLQKINYRCQQCNKAFKSNTSLYVHLQNVHKNKEEKDNLCHVCGKSYQNTAKLKYHIVAMHSGETPYACAHCAAAFSWYSSLYRHVREVHDKVKQKPKPKKSKKDNEALSSVMPHLALPEAAAAPAQYKCD